MTQRLLRRVADLARAGCFGSGTEPMPTGRSGPENLLEYVTGDGYAFASAPGGEVYLAADSLAFADALRLLRLTGRALELGSGSGVAAATLARTCSHVTAIDVVPAAVRASEATLALDAPPDRYEVIEGDMLAMLDRGRTFDAIAANLPFVPVPEHIGYSRFGRGGPDGLQSVTRALEALPALLSNHSVVCLKLHCAADSGEPVVVGPLRRALAATGHAGVVVVDGEVPMGFRAAQSARNAAPYNPGHVDLLAEFDRHYAALGSRFVSLTVVTATATGDDAPGDLTVIDPGASEPGSIGAIDRDATLPVVLRRFGVLTAALPEGWGELGTPEMLDDVAHHAEEILARARAGASLEECAAAIPARSGMDGLTARGYLVPVDRLIRAAVAASS